MGRIYQNLLQMRHAFHGLLRRSNSRALLQGLFDDGARQFVEIVGRRLRTEVIPKVVDIGRIGRHMVADPRQDAERHLHDLQAFSAVHPKRIVATSPEPLNGLFGTKGNAGSRRVTGPR